MPEFFLISVNILMHIINKHVLENKVSFFILSILLLCFVENHIVIYAKHCLTQASTCKCRSLILTGANHRDLGSISNFTAVVVYLTVDCKWRSRQRQCPRWPSYKYVRQEGSVTGRSLFLLQSHQEVNRTCGGSAKSIMKEQM